MAFQQGHEKLGGRRTGSPNHKTALLREIVEEAIGGTIPERLIELSRGDADQETQVLLALMPYCHAKIASVEISVENSKDPEAISANVQEYKDWYSKLVRMEIEEKIRSEIRNELVTDYPR